MIAFAKPAAADVHRQFEAMLPGIQGRLRRRFRRYGDERRDEYVAEAVAWSWQMFLAARRQGRQVTPGNLAWFAGKAVAAGRRLAGSTELDALSDGPLARRRIGAHLSLDSLTTTTGFCQTFGDRRWRWPVVDVVAPVVDLEDFMATCDGRDRRIVDMKLDGCQQKEIAEDLGISPSAVCLRLQAMRRRWDPQPVA
jgi:DNA-directed RNA polymerase specialized sigma24 family protein